MKAFTNSARYLKSTQAQPAAPRTAAVIGVYPQTKARTEMTAAMGGSSAHARHSRGEWPFNFPRRNRQIKGERTKDHRKADELAHEGDAGPEGAQDAELDNVELRGRQEAAEAACLHALAHGSAYVASLDRVARDDAA